MQSGGGRIDAADAAPEQAVCRQVEIVGLDFPGSAAGHSFSWDGREKCPGYMAPEEGAGF